MRLGYAGRHYLVAAALIALFIEVFTLGFIAPTLGAFALPSSISLGPVSNSIIGSSGEGGGSKMSTDPSNFDGALERHFPGSMNEIAFVEAATAALGPLGFNKENSIACVGVCRDEICGSLVEEVKEYFGEVFRFVGLGGFIFCGVTGFGAAHSHCPSNEDGRRRYVYIVAPHVGISEGGVTGLCEREGQYDKTSACGALVGLREFVKTADPDPSLSFDLDLSDVEMSLIKRIMVPRFRKGELLPDMAGVTKMALTAITEQLEDIISKTVDRQKSDYAVITGVQIHGPGVANNFFMPSTCYAVVDGEKVPFSLQK